MKKLIYSLFFILVLVAVGFYIFEKKIGTINIPNDAPAENAGESSSLAGLKLPEGFSISIFAKDVPGARVLEMDPKARILVSQTSEGKIVALQNTDTDPASDKQTVLASGLKKPHGMAFKCDEAGKCFLYVAESDVLSRFAYDADTPALGAKERLITIDSSITDRHFTRSLLFLPSPDDNILLISVGSSCDVCNEKDKDHASIISYDTVTGKKEVYAKGLRNATFMTLDPIFGKVYATEMGRDGLGDDIPPDEINIIDKKNNQPQNYGWPICYGKNIHDDKYDKNTYIRNPCMEPFETPSFVDLQAHSAPLGLAFIPEEGWPEDHWYNILVAYHGSWNRSEPTGYKIVRIKMDAKGKYLGTEDFITGWFDSASNKVTGRPVDIKVLSGGTAYITDDNAGVIYRLFRN